jgi:predicted acetyltransferase
MKEPIELRRLRLTDKDAFLMALSKWDNDRGFLFASSYQSGMDFAEYFKIIQSREKGENLPPGYVPDTSLYGFLDGEMVGRLSIRHTLNDFLLKVGGHIGYGILPEFRKRGFAKSMLRQSLTEAQKLGLQKVLVTCDDNNIGSIKTIESCHGLLENKIDLQDGQPLKRRYWIIVPSLKNPW